MTKTTTSALESAQPACSACNSALYLDAATAQYRCGACETSNARSATRGRARLASGSVVDWWPDAWLVGDAPTLFEAVLGATAWRCADDAVELGGTSEVIAQPREIAYEATSADEPAYSYPGLLEPLVPRKFSAAVDGLRKRVEETVFGRDLGFFNAVHLNLYRNGGDHVSWHTDEDAALYGPAPVIASVSLGAARTFVLRRTDLPEEQLTYRLGDGDLLVMHGATQAHYEHSVRKEASGGRRINITFRRTYPATNTPELRCPDGSPRHPLPLLDEPLPVLQTDFSPGRGNALQACVAAMFGLSLEEVPNFVTLECGYARGIADYLRPFGRAAEKVALGGDRAERERLLRCREPGSLCLLRGKSPRGDHLCGKKPLR